VLKNERLRFAFILLAVLAWPSGGLFAQEGANTLPEVTEHRRALCPPLARQARIRGQVRLRLTTNGHLVTDVAILQGHPLLAQFSADNVRTWKFADHAPGTFEVTFDYEFIGDAATFPQQPGLVQVIEAPEGGIKNYTLPEDWKAQVRNAQGPIDASLTLWTYQWFEDEIDGYVTRPSGQERPLRNSHMDGDMLGFDTTLEDKFGQRLKFSMIGKKTGEKITGVFLNYWGNGGTWTAVRTAKTIPGSSPAPPADTDETPILESDVAFHAHPTYSYFANEAGIQGTVQLRVTTDGNSATKFETESGNPFLVRDAIENLRTWRFAKPIWRTFEVTYSYQLLDERVEFLKEPGIVTVECTLPLVNGGGFANYSTRPEIWKMDLTSSRGNTHSQFSLVQNNDLLDGYMINEAPGWTGKKREAVQQGHQDGDMLGFDATVIGPDGKPLKISVLGKKTRNKITGVFLDFSGKPGTWIAVRQSQKTKPTQ